MRRALPVVLSLAAATASADGVVRDEACGHPHRAGVEVTCSARADDRHPTVFLLPELGTPAAGARSLAALLAGRGGMTVITVELPQDPGAAATVVRGLGEVKLLVAVGRAASAAARAGHGCRSPRTFFVEPVLDADAVRGLTACAAGRDEIPLGMILSDCDGVRARVNDFLDEIPHTTTDTIHLTPGCPATAAVETTTWIAVARTESWKTTDSWPAGSRGLARGSLDRDSHIAFAANFIAGGGSGPADDGLAIAARPELDFLRRGPGSLGFGVHGLAGSVPGSRPAFGGGLDLVIPFGSATRRWQQEPFLQPSLGVYAGDGGVFAAGLLIGFRHGGVLFAGSEIPFGLRVDAWFGLEDQRLRAITVSLSVDLLAAAIFAYIL